MSHANAVEDLLFAALEKATAAERTAYLDSACAGDAALRRQVEKLLKAHPHVGNFLKKPVVEQLVAAMEPADAPPESNLATDGPDAGPTGLYLPRLEGGRASDANNWLPFLQPSTRPDSLGRLGHYEVLEVLGQGGFGIVFRAFDEQLQRVVAIKVLSPEIAAASSARKRFLREARSSARVRHENVIQIYAVEEEPLPYLVMEFVPGETLQQRLDRSGPLEVTEVFRMGRQLAEGLAAAHGAGLIHRDIKPGNILLEAGPNQHVKLTDFGLARTTEDASLTQSGILSGTPMFMAPEQASAGELDQRADLFSLGSVLYMMCSGRPPFRAPSTLAVLKRVVEDTPRPIREIIPEMPPWLCDLIAKLHAKKPEDRIGTAKEVADLLGRGQAAIQGAIVTSLPVAAPVAVREGEAPAEPGACGSAGASPSHRGRNVERPREDRAPAGTVEFPVPAPALRPRSRSRRWVAAAAAMLVTLLGGLGITEATGVTKVRGTIIRLFSPEGTLEIQVDDPSVSVQIDGEDLVITGAGAKEIRLKPGRYTVEGRKDGKVVSRELVTVTKDGKQVVRVSLKPSPPGPVEETPEQKAARLAREKEKGVATPTTDPDRRAAEYVLSLGGRVKINEQDQEIRAAAALPTGVFRLTYVYLDWHNTKVTDAVLATLRDCKNLTFIHLYGCRQITDAGMARLKDCKQLMGLDVYGSQVTDAGLVYLKDFKNLTHFRLGRTGVTDAGLALLKDFKNLTNLDLSETPVTDMGIAHFKGCENMKDLYLVGCKQLSDAGLAQFKTWKNLTRINVRTTKVTAATIDELKKSLPKCKIEWDGGVTEPTANLDPDRRAAEYVLSVGGTVQLNEKGPHITVATDLPAEPFRLTKVNLWTKEVTAEGLAAFKDCKNLKDLNLSQCRQVKDLSPLKGLKLATLDLYDTEVSDLSPLTGMPLTVLSINNCRKVEDLSPLKGMPLTTFGLGHTQVSDLSPLKGMPLTYLNLHVSGKIRDLTPLKGMPLTELNIQDGPQVEDFSPLNGMRLTTLLAAGNPVRDLSPLKGMPLTTLGLGHCRQVENLSPLKGLPLTVLDVCDTQVRNLEPLKGMPLKTLYVFDAPSVTDLKPLQAMQLETICLTPRNITQGLDILRDMKSLNRIGLHHSQSWPAEEFWERYDKGEFKK